METNNQIVAPDYTAKRQIAHLPGLGITEVNRRLEALVARFGQAWLEKSQETSLQKLWARRDALATNQLILTGDALLSLSPHEVWLKRKVREIKNTDSNIRKGAMFELLGTNMLKAYQVQPTPGNTPGFDTVLKFIDASELYVSMKSYGKSVHEKSFEVESRETEEVFIQAAKSRGARGASLSVVSKMYPTADDWHALRKSLQTILAKVDRTNIGIQTAANSWVVSIVDVPEEVLPLSDTHFSYQVLFIAPYHKNEAKNLLDRLDEAAANARKHAGKFGGDVAHSVLVRLPERISLDACHEWAREYIASHPDGPVDLVLLYQPAVVDTDNGDSSTIDHAFRECRAHSYSKWFRPDRTVHINLLIGKISTGSKMVLKGAHGLTDIGGAYTYQRGEFFTLFQQAPGGGYEGTVTSLATGVTRHAVLKSAEGDEMLLQGIFPPEHVLSLFE